MAKNKDKKIELDQTPDISEAIKNLSVGTLLGGEQSSSRKLTATHVSLNLKKESFFSLPSGRVKLTVKQYSCKVPENLTNSEKERLQRAIDSGVLVEGDVFISPIDKNEDVLKEYFSLIKDYGLTMSDEKSPSTIKFRALFRLGVDRNWTAKEIANYCMGMETKGKNRKKILDTLLELHKYSDCPDTLFEQK